MRVFYRSWRLRKIAGALTALWFLLLGTGLVAAVHDDEHRREDAALLAAAKAAGKRAPQIPDHNESNCTVHAQLHMPLLAALWAPLLVGVGLLIGLLTLLRPAPVVWRLPVSVDCRGPPSC